MADYTSPASAFAQGQEAAQLATDNWRKNQAMQSLENIYGPIAGDPEDATKLQNYNYLQQADPLRLKALELGNTGADIENQQAGVNLDTSRQLAPYKVQSAANEVEGQDIGNQQASVNLDTSRQLAPYKVQEAQNQVQGGRLQNQGQSIQNDAESQALQAATAARDRATAQGLLATLTQAYNNGEDIGKTFDTMAPQIAALEGVDPAHMQPLRAALTQDPAGTINKLTAALAAANPTVTGKGTAAKANDPQVRQQQADALEVIQSRTAAVPDTINQAAALIPKMSGSAIIRKARAEIPGTPEYQFEALTHSVTSNLSLDDLRSLRTSGLSLGRTNIAEFTASAQAFGNLEIGRAHV